ncbi:573_t:CDS:2 [Paraglomus brasilianum]|uniref:573_t:CDS:1 n=1 Tax=Paraglomus brasilianum TaxID=144538 RepID=A0A9N9BP98_9GLOM|nr:573_t:CDS:2 [Paraglomus brasilianum]
MTANKNTTAAHVEHDSPPTAQKIATEFARHFYTILNREPEQLYRLYGPTNGALVYGDEGEVAPVYTGHSEILEQIANMNYHDCKVQVTNIDAQASAENGIVLQIIGWKANRDEVLRKFVQTVFLTPVAPDRYHILNDITRFVNDVDEDEEGDAHSDGSTEAESRISADEKIPDTVEKPLTDGSTSPSPAGTLVEEPIYEMSNPRETQVADVAPELSPKRNNEATTDVSPVNAWSNGTSEPNNVEEPARSADAETNNEAQLTEAVTQDSIPTTVYAEETSSVVPAVPETAPPQQNSAASAGGSVNETSVIPAEQVSVETANDQSDETSVQVLERNAVVDTSIQESPATSNPEDLQSYPGLPLSPPAVTSPTQEFNKLEQTLSTEPVKKSWASLAANGSDKWSSQLAETKGRVASVAPPQGKPLPQVREQRSGRQQEHRRNSDTSLSVYIRVASGLTYEQVKKAISTFGTPKYLDVVPTKGCAFAGFSTLDAYRAALNARQVTVGQAVIHIEERRKPSGASANTGGNRNQGSTAQGNNNRNGFAGNNRNGASMNQYNNNRYVENQNGNFRHSGNTNNTGGNVQNERAGSPIGGNKNEKRRSSGGNRPRQSGKNQL